MLDIEADNANSDLNLRPAGDDHRHLTREWAEHSIPDRFLQQVRNYPDRLAIRTRDGSFSYRELNSFANRVANTILMREPSGQGAVCVLLDHNDCVPAAIFGILRTGHFYVFLDSSYPSDRNLYLLKDSGASLIVTNDQNFSLAKSLVDDDSRLINIDDLKPGHLEHDPDVGVGPDNIAYLVYTSGSTGQPKGVIHTHRSSLHSAMRQVNGWKLCPDDRVGLLFTYNFGPATTNLLASLLTGASLHPFELKKEHPKRLFEWLRAEDITFFHTVPTFFRHLLANMANDERLPRLRMIRLAGEPIFGNDVRCFQDKFGGDCVLQVGMGSTETGVVLQSYYSSGSACPDGVVPPGFPAEDMEVLLLDDSGHPASPGEIGEIAVRSRYLFAGYWQRPKLTSQVLLPDPDDGEGRMYLMRDLGICLPDGRFKHLGRKDTQVKIRGHRVELGEVERALREIPAIVDAAVVANEADPGRKQLVAYIVRDDSATMPASSLRGLLKERVPDFMIPAAFVPLDSLPLTVSGKVDRAELSSRQLQLPKHESQAPRDFIEAQLLVVWEELLGFKGFGVRDDFFGLGGDSMLAMKLTLRIEELYGHEVNLANFPTEVTVEKLADVLEADERENLQQPILEIQSGGAATPLYFVHGDWLSGGVFCRNLARQLGPDQPFYAIPPHGLDGGSLPPTTEAMAADRVMALREFQPHGPYRLGGFCWGGLIALEMARLLEAQGEKVEALLLIDSDPKNIRLRPARRFIRRLRSWLAFSEDTELRCFAACRSFAQQWSKAGGVVAKNRLLIAKLLRLNRVFATLLRSDKSSGPIHDEVGLMDGPAVPEQRRARWATYHAIHQNTVPEPYSGRVVLFRSSRLSERYPDDPLANWRDIASNIETCEIDGDHLSCVTKHVHDVARKMAAYLSANSPRVSSAG
jgi:amino acid adenylation domain-containing protein